MNSSKYMLKNHIDSDNADEVEKEIMDLAKNNDVYIDAGELNYISSAGLRVVLKLAKKQGHLTIENVSRDAYEIFESTGFAGIMDIRKKPPFVSLDEAEYVGQGMTASVYKIDDDTIVKVFAEGIPAEMVYTERDSARKAFLSGISTAIPFDVVRTEKGLGVVYEKLKASSLRRQIFNEPDNRMDYLKRFANFAREMHKIHVDTTKYNSVRQQSIDVLPDLTKAGILTETEAENMMDFFQSIPERDTFIHGDCHIGNVKLVNGEFFFIDMSGCGYGHPIFDLLSMNTAYYLSPNNGIPVFPAQLASNFTPEECLEIWYTFLGEYLQTNDNEILVAASEQMEALAAARMICVSLELGALFTDEFLQMLKNIFNTYYKEKRRPIIF